MIESAAWQKQIDKGRHKERLWGLTKTSTSGVWVVMLASLTWLSPPPILNVLMQCVCRERERERLSQREKGNWMRLFQSALEWSINEDSWELCFVFSVFMVVTCYKETEQWQMTVKKRNELKGIFYFLRRN